MATVPCEQSYEGLRLVEFQLRKVRLELQKILKKIERRLFGEMTQCPLESISDTAWSVYSHMDERRESCLDKATVRNGSLRDKRPRDLKMMGGLSIDFD